MENIENFKDKIIHFWLDHLEIYGKAKNEEIFEKLDFDNSNYSEFWQFMILKTEVKKYKYKIIFSKDNYVLFSYYKGLKKWEWVNITTRDYVCFYSTSFKILWYENIFALLKNFELKHIRRFDICLDLTLNIEELLKFFKEPWTSKTYKKSWKIETKYFWEIKNSLNKREIIRIYNKLKDLVEKKKLKLYKDYLNFPEITRIELEIRQELAKNIDFLEIFDNEKIFSIFKNYIWKYSKIFENLWTEKISLYKKKVNFETFQKRFYDIKKYKNFVWYAKNIYEMWFCPIRILIWEDIITEQTKKILWYENIYEIIKKEQKIKEEIYYNKYLNKNLPKILDNCYKYGKI